MLGHRHRLGAGKVDQPPKLYFASFAVRVFITLLTMPPIVLAILAKKSCNCKNLSDQSFTE